MRENTSVRVLPDDHANALRLATGRLSLDRYQATFTGAVYPSDVATASLLAAHSGDGQRVAVGGDRSPWVYALADRLPTTRFVWLGSAYHLSPASEAVLVADLNRTPPAALLAQQPLTDDLQRFLQAHGYKLSQHTPHGDLALTS